MRDKVSDLIHRLFVNQVASCTCCTKTPALEYHDEDCNYRLTLESIQCISELENEIADYRVAFRLIKNEATQAMDIGDDPKKERITKPNEKAPRRGTDPYDASGRSNR